MSVFDQPREDMEKLAQILKAVWEAKMWSHGIATVLVSLMDADQVFEKHACRSATRILTADLLISGETNKVHGT